MRSLPIIATCTIIACTSMTLLADEMSQGAALLDTNCLSCHGSTGAQNSRVAPPMAALKAHYLAAFSSREDFVDAIVQWVSNPSEERSQMPGAIRRFGLMPMQTHSATDLKLIAEFIYEQPMDKPEWFDQHYKQEHGKD